MPNATHQEWEAYKDHELAWIRPALSALGYTLDERQPHIGGERYLMQALTTASGRKLILLAHAKDGARVVVKATSDAHGIRELDHERLCRSRLSAIRFAYGRFHTPQELLYQKVNGKALSIQAFIEQEKSFLERSTPEQFTLALSAFKTQEGAHAATYEHQRSIARTFGVMRTRDYVNRFSGFRTEVLATNPDLETAAALGEGAEILEASTDLIDLYGGFLTHTDFVPHNIRIVGSDIYLLDTSSLRFGNKYEGFARFMNFMELYNPGLSRAFEQYLLDNRAPEELRTLRLMRIYRLGEIIAYYTRTLSRSDGDLRRLNEERVRFWTQVLRAVNAGTPVPEAARESYIKKRDALRSPEEKVRQEGLH